MRKNVKFAIDEVCSGVEPTVAVMWHLGKILQLGIRILSGTVGGILVHDSDIILLQSGMVRSSHLPKAAVSTRVQQTEKHFLLGSRD